MILTRPPGRVVPRSAARSWGAAGLAVVGLVLSGCGSIGIHPGSAAVVGDRTISMNTINTTTRGFCEAFLPQIKASTTSHIPLRLLRSFVATGLAQMALGQQLADTYAVQPGPEYQRALGTIKSQFAGATPSALKAVLDVESGQVYLQSIQAAVGGQLLSDSGQSAGSTRAALDRGRVATAEWVRDHTVRMDPALGVGVGGGTFPPVDDETSYALSSLASQGVSQATSQNAVSAYAAQLPPSQSCG